MFRLPRFFGITSGIAFIIVTIMLGGLFNKLAVDDLIEVEESKNVALTEAIVESSRSRILPFVAGALRSADQLQPAALRKAVLAQVKGSSVVKLQLYDVEGITVFSTDESEIGTDVSESADYRPTRLGHIATALTHHGTFSAFDGTIEDRDLVSSYIPIRFDDPVAEAEGVLGLHSDVTPRLRQIGKTQQNVIVGVLLILSALFLILFAAVRLADRIIHGQYAANRAKSEFLARVSHELRTPMNAVLGFGRLLKADESLNHKQRRFIGHIVDSGEHLLTLIDDVLDITKIESGRMQLSMEAVEPAEILRECTHLIQPLTERHRVTLENRVTAGATPAVLADATRLKQVLVNLMSNAVKYNRENGQVTVACEEVQAGLRISVMDTGRGIPEVRIGELFEPFARLGAERDGIEGTGIGLTITNRLVELMGGQLGVESAVGEGSTFWVEFPLASAPSVAQGGGGQATTPTSATLRGRILVAEDNVVNQELVLELLGQFGLEVDVVENGREAVEAYLARPYDLVLMDGQMPEMDGFEATAEIRRHEVAAGAKVSIPIIALTANAMHGDRERCLEAGMDDYLSKPFSEWQLCEVLERWLPAVNAQIETSEQMHKTESADNVASIGGQNQRAMILDTCVLEKFRERERRGRKNVLSRIVGAYLQHSPQYIEQLREAVAGDNASGLQSAAHTLKSSSAGVGAVGLSAMCAELEELGRRDDMRVVAERVAELEALYAEVCEALREQCGDAVA